MKVRAAAYVGLTAITICLEGTAAARQASRIDFASRPASSIHYLKASNAGEDDRLGRGDPLVGVGLAMSADGNTLAIGADQADGSARAPAGNLVPDSMPDAGAVYLFVRAGDSWSQQALVVSPNPDVEDNFGKTVALSADGNTLLASVPSEDSAATGVDGDAGDNTLSSSGAAYVFRRNAGQWQKSAYLKASAPDGTDQFSWKLALSADGKFAAVTAISEASAAVGIDGDQRDNSSSSAGAVYLFEERAGKFTQRAYVKAPSVHGGDWFGQGLALSGDGTVLAVGAPFEDSAGTGVNPGASDAVAADSGIVYVLDSGRQN